MKPKIIKKRCIGCGECAENCSQDAIRISRKTNKAFINYDKCIGCEMCIDICPMNAIKRK